MKNLRTVKIDQGEPEVLMGQSIVLGEIKTETLVQKENYSNLQNLWQQYMEQIESLSQESKVNRFCMGAGFMRVVEVGQYSMTKDTGSLTQFRSVACREYTLPRDVPVSQPKGWILGDMRIGPVLEVTTSYMYKKHGIEYLMEQSNTWSTRITTIQKFLQIHLKRKRHKQVSRLLQADQKQKQESVDTPTSIPMHERKWIDIVPSEQSLEAYEVSQRVISLLDTIKRYSGKKMEQFNSGEFNFIFEIKFVEVQHWSDDRWKANLAAGGGSKRRYQYCSDHLGTILYLRALQGHSGHSLIDPTLQDNVIIQCGTFHHIYHVGCAFNFHSIINNGLVLGGQDSSRIQTVFFLLIYPRDKRSSRSLTD